ncbi:MAG: WD40 repeat domain-containing protein [Candidatus Hermodarchaeota archaeon]
MVDIKEKWTFQNREPILGIEIGDINNDGTKEVIAFSKSGKLLTLALHGNKLRECEISENSSIWQVSICDIDQDEKYEIILGGLDGLLRAFKINSSFELKSVWTHQFGASIGGFIHIDVNFDGKIEIVAYSIDKSIRCLQSSDGTLLWGQLFEDGIGNAITWKDSENPQTLEIIACGNDGTLRSFDGKTGELKWFKRFEDKVRCVSYVKKNNRSLIACGGDDKKFHLIDKDSLDELKSLQFNNYVWKCAPILLDKVPGLLVSTYSFDYFDDNIKIADINFNSELICLNSDFEKIWEIKNVNVETFIQIEVFTKKFIIVGTTKGKIFFLEAATGEVLAKIDKESCVNDLKYDSELKILISCHDNGSIFAYFLGNS